MNKELLIKNSLFNVTYRCANIIFPLLTTIYVARILQADSIGKVAAAQNFVSYFIIFASMGIPTYGIKLIGQFSENKNAINKSFWELFITNGILSLVITLLYYLLILNDLFSVNDKLLYCIVGLNLAFNVINVDWFYQGIQDYRYIAVRSLIIKVLSVVALFACVNDKEDYINYAIIVSAACVLNYIFNIIRLKDYIRLPSCTLNFRQHFNSIVILFSASIASEIYCLADVTMLEIMTNETTIGYYSMSMKIVKFIRTLVVAVSAVFLPQMSFSYFNQKYDDFSYLVNKGIRLILLLSFPIATYFCLMSKDIIHLVFGSFFDGAIISTSILSVSIISVAVSNFIGMQFLVTIGKEKIITISTIIGAVVNLFLNFFLIRYFQHYGASISSVITEIMVTGIQIWFASKYHKFNLNITPIIVSTFVMALSILFLKFIPLYSGMKLLFITISSVFVYLYVSILLKDEFILYIKDNVAKRLYRSYF